MITIFNRKQLTVVHSMAAQANIRAVLSKHDIAYKVRVVNRESPSCFNAGTRARTGSYGQRTAMTYAYTFYVKKQDFAQAAACVHHQGVEHYRA